MRNSPSEMPGTSPSRIAKFSDRGMPCGRDVSQTCRLIAFGIRPSQCDATNGHYSSSPMDFTLVQFMVQECLRFDAYNLWAYPKTAKATRSRQMHRPSMTTNSITEPQARRSFCRQAAHPAADFTAVWPKSLRVLLYV